MIAIHRYYDCAKKYQEGARLDSYNLEGAKAYSGTGLGRISDVGFRYSAGNSNSVFSLTAGAAITILRYHSTNGSNEIFAFVCDYRSFIGTISEETENSFKVTRDDDSYSTITIEDSTLKTTAGGDNMDGRKEYISPEFEVIEFETEDIIRTSTPSTGHTGGIYELPRIGSTFNVY